MYCTLFWKDFADKGKHISNIINIEKKQKLNDELDHANENTEKIKN